MFHLLQDVSKAIHVLYGKELQRLGAVDHKVFEDYVLRKMTAWYEWCPLKKGEAGGVETRMPSFNPLTGSKQSRRP